jgi:DNA-binding beta-propeller fold protein YncE
MATKNWGIVRAAVALVLLTGCVSVSRAELIVSSSGTDSVLQFSSATGAFLGTLVAGGSGGLDDPRGIAIGPDNRLYVASSGTDSILRYDAITGAFIDVFIAAGLDGPRDIGFGPDGNLYVADGFFPAQIRRFNGVTGADMGNFISADVPTLNSPLYFDFGFGELAVTTDTDRFYRFDAGTGVQLSSTVVDTPRGVAFGPGGDIYFAGSIEGGVSRRVASTGMFENFVAPSSISSPFDVAFGPDGNLFVSSSMNQVLRFDGATGAFIDEFVAAGSGGLSGPRYLLFAQPIPEPATYALVGLAALVIMLRARPARPSRGIF